MIKAETLDFDFHGPEPATSPGPGERRPLLSLCDVDQTSDGHSCHRWIRPLPWASTTSPSTVSRHSLWTWWRNSGPLIADSVCLSSHQQRGAWTGAIHYPGRCGNPHPEWSQESHRSLRAAHGHSRLPTLFSVTPPATAASWRYRPDCCPVICWGNCRLTRCSGRGRHA